MNKNIQIALQESLHLALAVESALTGRGSLVAGSIDLSTGKTFAATAKATRKRLQKILQEVPKSS